MSIFEEYGTFNAFSPKFLKWTLPSLNLIGTIAPNRGLGQKLKQNGKSRGP